MNAITSNRPTLHRMSARTANMSMTSRGIRIGIATVPRQRNQITPDAEKLQQALLSKPRGPDFPVMLGCCLATAFLIVMYAKGWLPGAGA